MDESNGFTAAKVKKEYVDTYCKVSKENLQEQNIKKEITENNFLRNEQEKDEEFQNNEEFQQDEFQNDDEFQDDPEDRMFIIEDEEHPNDDEFQNDDEPLKRCKNDNLKKNELQKNDKLPKDDQFVISEKQGKAKNLEKDDRIHASNGYHKENDVYMDKKFRKDEFQKDKFLETEDHPDSNDYLRDEDGEFIIDEERFINNELSIDDNLQNNKNSQSNGKDPANRDNNVPLVRVANIESLMPSCPPTTNGAAGVQPSNLGTFMPSYSMYSVAPGNLPIYPDPNMPDSLSSIPNISYDITFGNVDGPTPTISITPSANTNMGIYQGSNLGVCASNFPNISSDIGVVPMESNTTVTAMGSNTPDASMASNTSVASFQGSTSSFPSTSEKRSLPNNLVPYGNSTGMYVKPSWTNAEERHLVDVWEAYFEEFHSNSKRSNTYKKIAQEFPNHSLRSVQQKLLSYKKRYRKDKSEFLKTGVKPQWKLYYKIDEIHKHFFKDDALTILSQNDQVTSGSVNDSNTPIEISLLDDSSRDKSDTEDAEAAASDKQKDNEPPSKSNNSVRETSSPSVEKQSSNSTGSIETNLAKLFLTREGIEPAKELTPRTLRPRRSTTVTSIPSKENLPSPSILNENEVASTTTLSVRGETPPIKVEPSDDTTPRIIVSIGNELSTSIQPSEVTTTTNLLSKENVSSKTILPEENSTSNICFSLKNIPPNNSQLSEVTTTTNPLSRENTFTKVTLPPKISSPHPSEVTTTAINLCRKDILSKNIQEDALKRKLSSSDNDNGKQIKKNKSHPNEVTQEVQSSKRVSPTQQLESTKEAASSPSITSMKNKKVNNFKQRRNQKFQKYQKYKKYKKYYHFHREMLRKADAQMKMNRETVNLLNKCVKTNEQIAALLLETRRHQMEFDNKILAILESSPDRP